ncbi:hypothetical protein M271_20205 [Streptomyces rapamycinicus NRRL 5491]|nr:hypothetical protein M271_20205 [Streptomyces rapamycinicus NRRL 5491]
MMALAKPANVGVANSSIMIVPWIVNSSLVTICSPGRANSARMTIASMPANKKNPNEVIKYRWAIFL